MPRLPLRSGSLLTAALLSIASLSVASYCFATPTAAQQLVEQARQHSAAGDTARARARLAEAVRIDPAFGPAWLELATIHERAGDTAEALRVYRAALDRVPAFVDGLTARARLLERVGQFDLAAQDLRAAVSLAPANPALRAECVDFFVRARSWAAALQHSRAMQQLLSHKGDAGAAASARVRTLALGALAAETDPVGAGRSGRGWERRALAAAGRRSGAL